MKRIPFPRYIDRTKMVGMFEIDEFFFIFFTLIAAIIIGFVIGMNVAAAMASGLFGGFFIAGGMRTIKRKYAEGFLFHMAYRKGLYHPVKDDKAMIVKHPEVVKKKLKLVPSGYVHVLVD